MNAGELRQAIEMPAVQGGWELSAGLVDLLLHDVGATEGRQRNPAPCRCCRTHFSKPGNGGAAI
jgi:hypothetical protein